MMCLSWKVVAGVAVCLLVAAGCSDGKKDSQEETQPGVEESSEKEDEKGAFKPTALVDIPAGSFLMGAEEGYADDQTDEHPQHEVTLGAFQIEVTEVTVDQFDACLKAGACKGADFKPYEKSEEDMQRIYCNYGHKRRSRHPMNCVTWDGAKHYCEWIGRRLPTEAEWEKAARGGCELDGDPTCVQETDGRHYPWGNLPPECEHGRMGGCGWNGTTHVGTFEKGKGPYGTYDQAGNVFEWTADWYGSEYYKSGELADPKGPEKADEGERKGRVFRGGSWAGHRNATRVTFRNNGPPDSWLVYVGFRCAK